MLVTLASCEILQGSPGKDGETPTITISDDGYWVINGEKTNVKASSGETVDENSQGLQFYIQDDGTYKVSCGDAKYLSNIEIPATYKGGAVVYIEGFAFSNCTSLTSVTIPDSVTRIGVYAFNNCTSLTSINFEGTVKQWNAIEFGDDWNDYVPATEVVCTDGTVKI